MNELDDLLPFRRLIATAFRGHGGAHPVSRRRSCARHHCAPLVANALREELRFEGAVFTDDLSMGGAAEFGDIVARAKAALDAGCDVLPVCNDRTSVAKLLDELDIEVEPAAHLRLVRMRGRPAPEREALYAGDAWRTSQDLLERAASAPKLKLTAGNA